MEKIKHFFECLLPTTLCNLECEYCYIIQENRRGMEQIKLDYNVEYVAKALSKNRLGGVCYFSICGTGETLLQKECVELVHLLLREGHFINITTNGTVTKKMIELLKIDNELLKHLHISFSFHYLELKKRNMLNNFFENVERVREKGCSFIVQLNLYDGYIPYVEEIKKICIDKLGALPQVAATRFEKDGSIKSNINLHTSLSLDEYKRIGKQFNSPLFDFTMNNFNIKRREFCYAGDWAFNLNLRNGDLKACYESGKRQNIFENINNPIALEAVGNNCNSLYCVNSSHLLSLGCIPSLDTPTYAFLRNRKEAGWYNDEVEELLNNQFKDYKIQYSLSKRIYINAIGTLRELKRKIF